MTARFALDQDAFVLTPLGPVFTGMLQGQVEVAIVGMDGGLSFQAVSTIKSAAEPIQAWHVLSDAGDLRVTEQTKIVTRRGPMLPEEMESSRGRGDTLRLEVMRTPGISFQTPRRDAHAVVSSALAAMSGQAIVIPADSEAEGAAEEVEWLLEKARIPHSTPADDKWRVFLPRVEATAPPVVSGDPVAADWILSLTGWSPQGTSRTRMDQTLLRGIVLAQLITVARPMVIEYVPAYHPVEVHVRSQGGSTATPYATLKGMRRAESRFVEVGIAADGYLICNLHLIGSL